MAQEITAGVIITFKASLATSNYLFTILPEEGTYVTFMS